MANRFLEAGFLSANAVVQFRKNAKNIETVLNASINLSFWVEYKEQRKVCF